jgi:hypothetical protein
MADGVECLKVVHHHSKGKITLSKRDFNPGDVILKEKPLMQFDEDVPFDDGAMYAVRVFLKAPEAIQQKVLKLYQEPVNPLEKKARVHFGPLFSLDASVSVEEITISYINGRHLLHGMKDRKMIIENERSFNSQCKACLAEYDDAFELLCNRCKKGVVKLSGNQSGALTSCGCTMTQMDTIMIAGAFSGFENKESILDRHKADALFRRSEQIVGDTFKTGIANSIIYSTYSSMAEVHAFRRRYGEAFVIAAK